MCPGHMALYKYPGYEMGQGGTMKPGNLEGDSGGTNKPILGATPPIFHYVPPESPLKIPRFHCPPLACFLLARKRISNVLMAVSCLFPGQGGSQGGPGGSRARRRPDYPQKPPKLMGNL